MHGRCAVRGRTRKAGAAVSNEFHPGIGHSSVISGRNAHSLQPSCALMLPEHPTSGSNLPILPLQSAPKRSRTWSDPGETPAVLKSNRSPFSTAVPGYSTKPSRWSDSPPLQSWQQQEKQELEHRYTPPISERRSLNRKPVNIALSNSDLCAAVKSHRSVAQRVMTPDISGQAVGNLSMAGAAVAAKASTPSIVKLCQTVKSLFSDGKRPTGSDITIISTLLGSIPLHELGIRAPSPPSVDAVEGSGKWTPPITYLHIHECQDYAVGIFCLPKNANIPLHNHPGMTVFSRLLYGKMHVKSYDLIESSAEGVQSGQYAVRAVRDAEMDASADPSVLFPSSGGNIHSFTAVTDCAVLDVLAPPYAQGEGRDCTYYRDAGPYLLPHSQHKAGNLCLLEEFEPPVDFVVIRGQYNGVKVDRVGLDNCEHHSADDRTRGGSVPEPLKAGGNRDVTVDSMQRLHLEPE